MKKILLLLTLISVSAFSEDQASLREEFDQLKSEDFNNLPHAPDIVYSVNERLVPLKKRLEVGVFGSNHFKSESFVDSKSTGLYTNFHFTEHFSLGLEGKYFFNELSDAGHDLINKDLLVPEVIYPKFNVSLLGSVNLFYGKIRLSFENTVHYDLYVLAGPTFNMLSNQTSIGATSGAGFAFWLSKHLTLRAQLVDSYHREQRRAGAYDVHDFVGSLGMGGLI